jgi:hypothetical protein
MAILAITLLLAGLCSIHAKYIKSGLANLARSLGGEYLMAISKRKSNTLGVWAFTIGVVAALVLGFIGSFWELGDSTQRLLAIALGVIGIIVGILNVSGDEAMSFLTVTAILVFVSFAGASAIEQIWAPLANVFNALMLLFVPATIIVAIRALWTLARD